MKLPTNRHMRLSPSASTHISAHSFKMTERGRHHSGSGVPVPWLWQAREEMVHTSLLVIVMGTQRTRCVLVF